MSNTQPVSEGSFATGPMATAPRPSSDELTANVKIAHSVDQERTSSSMPKLPLVSVVIPCRSEARHIGDCIASLIRGTYPQIELLVVDGRSADATRSIVGNWAERDGRVKLIDNPEGTTPEGLNRGIAAAGGEFITILGAHSEPSPDWVMRAVEALEATPEAAAVGGVLETRADTEIGRVIAMVQSTRFGVGNARFRVGGKAGFVDTVVFGCYRRRVFEKYGPFDTSFRTNQDDELNLRLISSGERLFFDPAIHCGYYARTSAAALLRQYWRYGRFKWNVFIKNRRVGSWRQLVPAAWVALVLAAVAVGLSLSWICLVALLSLYVAAGAPGTWRAVKSLGPVGLMYFPIAASVHVVYGCGMWFGFLAGIIGNVSRFLVRTSDK